MSIFTRDYWIAALERAVSAGAAAATAGGVITAANGLDLSAWRTVALGFGVGFIFSILKGLAANATNGGLGPGVGSAEVTQPTVPLPGDDGEPRGTDHTPEPEQSAPAPVPAGPPAEDYEPRHADPATPAEADAVDVDGVEATPGDLHALAEVDDIARVDPQDDAYTYPQGGRL